MESPDTQVKFWGLSRYFQWYFPPESAILCIMTQRSGRMEVFFMEIKLTEKQFRRLLDLVYIGNWVLNSTRGDDRIRASMTRWRA